MDDVILNKVASIERCVQQIRTFYEGHEDDFATSHLRQDAIILNIQRACEQSIDLANHIVRIKQLGIPKTSKYAFSFLHESAIIDNDLRQRLQAMVGFRNIAVEAIPKMFLTAKKIDFGSEQDAKNARSHSYVRFWQRSSGAKATFAAQRIVLGWLLKIIIKRSTWISSSTLSSTI